MTKYEELKQAADDAIYDLAVFLREVGSIEGNTKYIREQLHRTDDEVKELIRKRYE